jgi:hypothetical protein
LVTHATVLLCTDFIGVLLLLVAQSISANMIDGGGDNSTGVAYKDEYVAPIEVNPILKVLIICSSSIAKYTYLL